MPRAVTYVALCAAAVWAGSGTVLAAQTTADMAPCLDQRASLNDYVAAFEAEGWTMSDPSEAPGRAVAEPLWAFRILARTFQDPDDVAQFLQGAHGWFVMAPGYAVMSRDDLALAVWQNAEGDAVSCVLAARDIGFVGDLVAGETQGPMAFVMAGLPSIVKPAGVAFLSIDAIRIHYDHVSDPQPAGGDALTMAIKFKGPAR